MPPRLFLQGGTSMGSIDNGLLTQVERTAVDYQRGFYVFGLQKCEHRHRDALHPWWPCAFAASGFCGMR
jgi:hypothetical protein